MFIFVKKSCDQQVTNANYMRWRHYSMEDSANLSEKRRPISPMLSFQGLLQEMH